MPTPLRYLAITVCAASLAACASLGGPSSADIARLPVVDFGQAAPAGDFVLRYPAGADLPVVTRVDGDLFAKTDQATLNVRLKHDIYLYRDKASLDGKTWQNGHTLVGGRIAFSLPGERDGKLDAQSPAELSARFDRR